MRIVARVSSCQGHARCAAVAPELFELNDDGYLDRRLISVPAGLEEKARAAVRACPEAILRIDEDGSSAG